MVIKIKLGSGSSRADSIKIAASSILLGVARICISTESVECRREPRLMQLDGFRDMCGCQALVVQKLQTPQLGDYKGPRTCGVAHGVAEHRQAAQGHLAPQMRHLPHIHQLITTCNLIVL